MRRTRGGVHGFFLVLLASLVLSACGRDDFSARISAQVMLITRGVDGEGITIETRRAAPGVTVYLRPFDPRTGRIRDVSRAWKSARTNAAGIVQFGNAEGVFDLFADVDGDGRIDGRALRIPSGMKTTIAVITNADPADDPDAEEPEPEDPDPVDEDPDDETPDPVTEPPPPPIANYSIEINNGDATTNSYLAVVRVEADHATHVALTENPALLPDGVTRVVFTSGTTFGFQLSPGQGPKVVWAMFYNEHGDYAGPVSDMIVFHGPPPTPAIVDYLDVTENPPGTEDYLRGVTGAVEPNNTVRVYADRDLTHLIANTTANPDGSFGPVSILDGSMGNVEPPYDAIYITSTDYFGRESLPVWVTNDSTAPELNSSQLEVTWIVDGFRPGVGNPGDVLRFRYIGFDPSFVGGTVNMTSIGGPVTGFGGVYPLDVTFTVEADSDIEAATFIAAHVWDAAGNVSGWVVSTTVLVDSRIPATPSIEEYRGGNRRFHVRWDDPNLDVDFYAVQVSDETGTLVVDKAVPFMEYQCWMNGFQYMTGFRGVLGTFEHPDGQYCIPGYVYEPHDLFEVELDNCHVYDLRVRAIDFGGNLSEWSPWVQDRVIIPPPGLEAWTGLADVGSGLGTLYYSLEKVDYASEYEFGFSVTSGAPYAWSTGTVTSPARPVLPPKGTVPRIDGLPVSTRLYLSARAFDDTCASDYAAEISRVTDLRVFSKADGMAAFESLGGALALAGDLDSDGNADLAVGAMQAEYVGFVDTIDGGRTSTFGALYAPIDYDLPASPVAVTDVMGGPELEVLVGSPLENAGGVFMAGRVRIYDLSGVLLDTIDGTARGQQFGHSIATLDDLTFDGKAEFLVGSLGCENRDCGWPPLSDDPPTQGPGSVTLYDGALRVPLATLQGQAGQFFGASLSTTQDFDGDGVRDIVIGAPGAVGHPEVGKVYLISPVSGLLAILHAPLPWALQHRFGVAVSASGDLNGDGVPDIIVGAPGVEEREEGYVYAFTSETHSTWEYYWHQTGLVARASSRFGSAVDGNADLNGDGMPDVLVGAPGAIQSFAYGPGSVYVLDGRNGEILYEVRGQGDDGGIGYSVLTLPDLNGDPRYEWAVGAPGSAYGGNQAGRVYIFTTDP